MTLDQANEILNKIKAGTSYPAYIVDQALQTTGDLSAVPEDELHTKQKTYVCLPPDSMPDLWRQRWDSGRGALQSIQAWQRAGN